MGARSHCRHGTAIHSADGLRGGGEGAGLTFVPERPVTVLARKMRGSGNTFLHALVEKSGKVTRPSILAILLVAGGSWGGGGGGGGEV